MPVLNVMSKVLAAALRLILRLIGLVLALILVLALLVFIFFWILLRLVSGRRPEVDVSAHFSKVRVFTNLGGTVFRASGHAPSEETAGQWRRSIGPAGPPAEVEDVQPRELPRDKS
jgi:thiol:disulfide interchange protein